MRGSKILTSLIGATCVFPIVKTSSSDVFFIGEDIVSAKNVETAVDTNLDEDSLVGGDCPRSLSLSAPPFLSSSLSTGNSGKQYRLESLSGPSLPRRTSTRSSEFQILTILQTVPNVVRLQLILVTVHQSANSDLYKIDEPPLLRNQICRSL